MPDSAPAARRRILSIVILIVFMVALAVLYTAFMPRNRVRRVGVTDAHVATSP